ncbi:MAG: DEAD/DEAH box helicase, partial [bacterium]|nr:DEAD/DEAH box helicase [bacterium]
MGRDELKAACRACDLDDSGRSRSDFARRLLEAHGDDDTEPVKPLFSDQSETRTSPQVGDIAQVRHRQYLVEEVVAPAEDAGSGAATLVRLVCLDDDNQGRRLEVLWELELGARVLQPRTHGLGDVARLDPPRHFGAYLNALRWNVVTATEARLFQAPFRAGIQLMSHQLPPLKRALELPRANLFIADDVGLGKTIEAGLVLQELQLRQRVDFVLIVCPAAICLQWRDEMARRFGLHFELYNRAFVGRRRQERGFQVNPWDTHNRFVISYQTLRRPEYREPLLRHLGERTRKSLLILDEAHTAAPSTASKYAVDTRVTRVIRDVAPRFENRLFLSATPHNGHSNSFSALLELLDPQRFTRGVAVRPEERDRVMVRRLKADLRKLGGKYPVRNVVRIELRHESGSWKARANDEDERAVGQGPAAELRLSLLLRQYAELMKPKSGSGQLVFSNLQNRLLSSIEAFRRTLGVHAR